MQQTQKLAAIILSGPFGSVKEQYLGLYANKLASRGFITLAFDPSFKGGSGGDIRNVSSLEIFTEDFSAAVDYNSFRAERIGDRSGCKLR